MFNFLHTFNPYPILVSLGPIHIYWYGFFIILGFLSALTVAISLAKFYGLKTDTIIDLAFWLIFGGLIGARIYDVFLEWPYFAAHPLDILKIWQGGLAIHGAIIGGGLALWLFTKKYKHNVWQLAAIMATVLPLAQAIGRWGNYFNQELFGRPTNLPWGIPINPINRPWQYLNLEYFHPAFLYESLGCLIIFTMLIIFQGWIIKNRKFQDNVFFLPLTFYLLFYSLLRFALEFIRIDETPVMFGWRFPQIVSLLCTLACSIFLALKLMKKSH